MTEQERQYPFDKIEKKWQGYWDKAKLFRMDPKSPKEKYYCLVMFPYPSAALHVGHGRNYILGDAVVRYKLMKGYNVLSPIGWDAFGLPAENAAIKGGQHPRESTLGNVETMKRQLNQWGIGYDWSREIASCLPDYYKWTQWIFSQIYDTWYDPVQKKGRPIAELPIPAEVKTEGPAAVRAYRDCRRLAYYAGAQVWWCRQCQIVCANEEVLNDGSHEKCGSKEVERRFLKQWLLRIPLYAERLLEGLDTVEWPAGIKEMQRNWIGKSTGAEVDFQVQGQDASIRVFTTRPDTLFGATYMVLSPE
ncbi:MAG: class I tRNA ligase family protein, partial [Candidatus Omnitrophica bacterium]|nr:class I tRNA ligase family protein [Candidatus Omnitrophota bacterium]